MVGEELANISNYSLKKEDKMSETVKVSAATVLVATILLYAVATILALPAAFLLMVFLGNVGINISFWATLPGAIVLASLNRVNKDT